MAKLNWVADPELALAVIEKERIQVEHNKYKGKTLQKLTAKEKDDLLEKIAKQLGYL